MKIKKLLIKIFAIQLLIMFLFFNSNIFGSSSNYSVTSSGNSITISVNNIYGKFEISVKRGKADRNPIFFESNNGKETINISPDGSNKDMIVTVNPVDISDKDENELTLDSQTKTIKVSNTSESKKTETTTSSKSNSETTSSGSSNNKQTEDPNPSVTSKSSNRYLKSLTVSQGTLSPVFSRDREEYKINFPDDFDYDSLNEITISAQADDSRATVKGTGTQKVNDEGVTDYYVEVTAEDGGVKSYKISLEKPQKVESSDIRLNSLAVDQRDSNGILKGAVLTPTFDPNTLEYTMDVEDDIQSLVFYPKANEGIVVSVEGADNSNEYILSGGENDIYINLTSTDDDSLKTTYKIAVNKPDIEDENSIVVDDGKTEENDKSLSSMIIAFIVAAIIVLLILAIVLLTIYNKKKKNEKLNKDDDEIDDGDSEDVEPDEEEQEDDDEPDENLEDSDDSENSEDSNDSDNEENAEEDTEKESDKDTKENKENESEKKDTEDNVEDENEEIDSKPNNIPENPRVRPRRRGRGRRFAD